MKSITTLLLAGMMALLPAALEMQAATVRFDGGASGAGTALDTAANWVGDALPGTTSEVLLDNSQITLPTQLTTTGASPTWGSLIWNNNANSAITINTSTTTSRTITLSGGGGSTEALAQGGAAGDLILMGSNATSNTLTIGGNAGAGTGRLNLALGASGNFNVVNAGATLSITSIISGAFGMNKTGAGTLTLSGVNTFSGDTKISGGSLVLSTVATNLQSSILDYNNYGGTLSFGSLAAATIGGIKGSQNLVLTNASSTAVALTVGTNTQETSYAGSFSGLGSFGKTGAGTLTLTGSHSHAGTTSVTGGTLNLGGSFTDTGTLSVSGASTTANLTGTYSRTTYSSGSGLSVAGGTFNMSGTLGTSAAVPTGQTAFSGNSITNFSGTAYLSGSSSTFRVAEVTSATVNVTAGTVTIGTSSGGVVLGRNNANARGFLNVSGGSFIISGNTSIRIGAGFTDAETSGASELSISGTGLFTTGTTTGVFLLGSNLSGNAASTGTLHLNGGTLATNRVITGGSVGASFVNFNGGTFKATGNAATFATSVTTIHVRDGGATVDTNGFSITFAKALTHSSISGDNATDGGLTKTGAGTLALTGTNTYTGATLVSAGVLQVGVAGAGSTGAGSTMSVNGPSAVLAGTGTVNGSATVMLGQIKPGDGAGQNEGTLTFAGGLAFDHAADATAAELLIKGTTTTNESGDKIVVTGALTMDGNSAFTVSPGAGWVPVIGQSWTLMDWTGLLTLNGWNAGSNLRTGGNTAMNEGDLDLPDISGTGVWEISALVGGTSGGSLTISIVAVPEPSRLLLVACGFLIAYFRRRR